MGFIDTSERPDMPVFYNVYQAVGCTLISPAKAYNIQGLNYTEDTPAVFGSDDYETPISPRIPGMSLPPSHTTPTPEIPGMGNPSVITPPISTTPKNQQSQNYAPCPNRPDDVKLVQYLLKAFYDNFPPDQRPKGTMKIDGICGPITNNWILRFQLDTNRLNGEPLVLVDNRVDKVENKNLIGSISHKMYTLAVLNLNVQFYSPGVWAQTPTYVPMENPNNIPIVNGSVVTTGAGGATGG